MKQDPMELNIRQAGDTKMSVNGKEYIMLTSAKRAFYEIFDRARLDKLTIIDYLSQTGREHIYETVELQSDTQKNIKIRLSITVSVPPNS